MSRTNLSRIQAAARECFSRCQGHDKPERAIVAFLMELRLDSAWLDDDVEQVELTTFRMLAAQTTAIDVSPEKAA